MYVLIELGYVLICHVKEKRKKKCSFENAPVEKSESSTRNKNGLVEGLLLFSIQMFTFTDLSRYIIRSVFMYFGRGVYHMSLFKKSSDLNFTKKLAKENNAFNFIVYFTHL